MVNKSHQISIHCCKAPTHFLHLSHPLWSSTFTFFPKSRFAVVFFFLKPTLSGFFFKLQNYELCRNPAKRKTCIEHQCDTHHRRANSSINTHLDRTQSLILCSITPPPQSLTLRFHPKALPTWTPTSPNRNPHLGFPDYFISPLPNRTQWPKQLKSQCTHSGERRF